MAEKEFKYLVRVANTDLDGNKALLYALCKIKGVSLMFANAVCRVAEIDPKQKTGYMNDEDVKKVSDILLNPTGVPTWMYNRQRDYETGEDQHLLLADLTFTQDNDVKRLKMIKSTRGLRHQWGLPLRGQRTKSNFRKTKTATARKRKQLKKTGSGE